MFEKSDRETKADVALRAAEALVRGGDKEKGKSAFEAVVKDYAGTKAADAAKKRLDEWK